VVCVRHGHQMVDNGSTYNRRSLLLWPLLVKDYLIRTSVPLTELYQWLIILVPAAGTVCSMAYFILDNSSPEVLYSPFADSFQQPDLLQGWNPYFSVSGFPSVQGQIGIGTAFHITSLNGATLSIQWHGMLFTPHTTYHSISPTIRYCYSTLR